LETKILNSIIILFLSVSAHAVDEGCLNKALTEIEKKFASLPPGADDFFRKQSKALIGHDPSPEQVVALEKAYKKMKGGKSEEAAQILRDSKFSEEEVKKLTKNDALKDMTVGQGVTLAPREVASAAPAKTAPPAASQSSAPRMDTPSAQLADAMNTGKDVQAAFQKSKAEVNQIISKTGGNNLSVEQLAEFSTRGLSPDDAVKYMKGAVTNEADFNKAISTLDRRIASVGSGAQAEYSAAQMQELRVKTMEAYYAQKYKVKPGYSVIEALDDADSDAFSAANEKLAQLLNAKNKKNWPTGR
jgi:hypothetical protein